MFNGREIRADRDAIRSILDGAGRPIKLEIIHFDSNEITQDSRDSLFPVPVVSPQSCFTTKLLANADRYNDSQKDIIDLLMMKAEWDVVEEAWQSAYQQYGQQVILHGLHEALKKLTNDPHAAQVNLTEQMNIEPVLAEKLTTEMPSEWLSDSRFDC